MQNISDIIRLITELLVLIPMVVALVKYIRKAIREKNWKKILNIAIKLMEQAEAEFENGTDRKSFVMSMLRTSCDEIKFDITDEELSDLIDNMVDLTNKLNIK
ncbi:MAG: hypothetical protein J6S67_19965 [Methanobrevibacter sp.]|nr:hypothetical protein [Methanobrevibacter sp.]